jgi:hypothetical protein
MALSAIILNGSVQLTGNPAWINVTGASAPSGSSLYKLLLKVESTDDDIVGAPFVDAIPPNDEGQAMFDISGYIDQPVTAKFQYPVSLPILGYTGQIFTVTVTPGESYIDEDGVLQENWGTASSEIQFVKGGVSQRQLGMWSLSGNFYGTYINGQKWLTLRPWGDFIHPNQPAKLYFVSKQSQTLNYEIKYYFDNGTSGTYDTVAVLTDDAVHEFNCNPKFLSVDIQPTGKRVEYFDVRIRAGGNNYSDVRRFHYDWKFCERPYFLMFANSLGGVDDVYLAGFGQEKFVTEGTTVTKPAAYGANELEPTLIVPNRKGRNSWTINTGYKTASQMRHLRDLMLSRQAWLLYPNLAVSNYIVIPVIVEPGEQTIVDYLNDLHAMDIEITEAHDNKYGFDNSLY